MSTFSSDLRQSLGRKGESLAAEYLQKKGYKIIERNWKPQKWGEIDLIAIDHDTLVFVEVKARSVDPQLKPYEAVTDHKIQTLKRAGFIYSQEHPQLPKALRIDVVSVEFDERQKPKIEYFKDVREGIDKK